MNQKYFVLDTNVLLYSPESLNSFGENTIVIPLVVIEELDKFKTSLFILLSFYIKKNAIAFDGENLTIRKKLNEKKCV